MTYEFVTRLAFAILLALSATLIFIPGLIFWLFQIVGEPSTHVMARRAGMLFLGLSALCFVTADAVEAGTRQAVSFCFFILMSGLALLGVIEFFRGAVGPGIWLAIIVEVFFGYSYLMFWRDEA